jgi:purine-nucleoside phosphorylase
VTDHDAVRVAAGHLARRLGDLEPRVALVLGSGLGRLVRRFDEAVRVPCAEIPGWPVPSVEGHEGLVVAGRLAGLPVLGLGGRVHLYEGHEPDLAVLPVRVAAELGARILFVTNAAGATRRRFAPGDLMLITDHINLMGANPLVGGAREGEARWPDMARCYDPGLRELVRAAALAEGLRLQQGVYAGLRGPSYETPAEVAMLARLGADAVGMSTVPEVLAARALGVRCVGVSCLTNHAAGVSAAPVRHEDVLEAGRRAAESFERLVLGTLRKLASTPPKHGPPGLRGPTGKGEEA